MTFVVTEQCIKCKYTDCVEVCPVDCFHEGPNMLVIDPDECIDCTLCEPECPVEAILSEDDLTEDQHHFLELNEEPLPDLAGAHREEGRSGGRRGLGVERGQVPVPRALNGAPPSARPAPSEGRAGSGRSHRFPAVDASPAGRTPSIRFDAVRLLRLQRPAARYHGLRASSRRESVI